VLTKYAYQVHCFNRDFISQSCNIISEFERVFAGPKVLNPGTNSMFIDAHRGKEEKGVRLEKHGHKSAIKHEIRAPPPRYPGSHKNPLKRICPKPQGARTPSPVWISNNCATM
jgi:hypothetical protein